MYEYLIKKRFLVASLGTLWAHRPVNADIVDTSTGS
jgi:hypothetical protein